jgi:hypothetical protein
MIQLVNGVQLFSVAMDGDSFEDTIFQLIFEDNEYFKKTITMDFLQVNVVDFGPMWILVIKDVSYEEYLDDKTQYLRIMGEIRNRVAPFMKEMYGFDEEEIILGDHESMIYGCNSRN